jgi:hypothetical protein
MAGASVRSTALRSLASLSLAVAAATSCSVDDLRQPPPLGQGGSSSSAGSGTSGVCTERATRDCHITLSQHGEVLTCYAGVETCSNGRWGACTSGTVSHYKVPPASARSGLPADLQGGTKPLSLSDAGPCPNNPCDPTCQTFDETPDGGITPEAGATDGGTPMGINGITAYPTGWQRNPNVCRPSVGPPSNPNCTSVSPSQGVNYCDICSYDMHCSGPNGTCVQNAPNASSGPILGCSGTQVDLTTLYPCLDANDMVHIPVCNRGFQAVNDVFWIGIYSGASNIPSCMNPANTPDKGQVSYDASQGPVLPGQCVDVYFSRTNTQPDGNIQGKISWQNDSLPSGSPQRAIATNWNAGSHECNYCNNWSVWTGDTCGSQSPPYKQFVYTDALTSTCPPGTRVQWSYLNYTAQPPPTNQSGSASIVFAVQTAPQEADGGAGTFSPQSPATVATILPDPASCVLPCTKDIYTPLGLPAARDEVLKVSITFNPTPDGQAAPTVNAWSVSYSCPPSE